MKKSKGTIAIEQAARKNGVSVAEARKEIDEIIREGMRSTLPSAVAFWDKLSKNRTKIPTPEEFIVAAAKCMDGDDQPRKISWPH